MQLRYLSKKEAWSYKNQFIYRTNEIRLMAKERFSICFSLVGSSKRNMILVRDDGKPSSFDFDYQLLISKIKTEPWSLKEIKNYFIELFRNQFLNEDWKIEDSTSAITIKNRHNNYSFDVVIIEINCKTLRANVLKHYKTNNKHIYSWEELSDYKNHRKNLKLIKGINDWSELREIYKDKKGEGNQTESYLLFIQSVNEFVQKHY